MLSLYNVASIYCLLKMNDSDTTVSVDTEDKQLQEPSCHRRIDSNSSSEKEQSRENSPGKKTKICCPYCEHFVVAFPRHLREYHRYSKEASRLYVRQASLKRLSNSPKKSHLQRTRTMITCPVEGCMSVVSRIDKHLNRMHDLRSGHKEYKRYISLSKSEDFKRRVLDESPNEEDDSEDSDDKLEEEDFPQNDKEDNVEQELAPTEEVPEGMRGEASAFRAWLQSFGGGSKTSHGSHQMQKQVLLVLGSFGDDFSKENVTDNLEKLEHEFIPKCLKTKQASTVKTYLLTFSKFSNWAKLKSKSWMTFETADCIDKQIKIWNQSLNKDISRRNCQIKMDHQRSSVTVEEVQMYLDGKRAKEGREVFAQLADEAVAQASNKFVLTQRLHTAARNHLIMLLVLSNATRAGPILNLRLKDVENARANVHNGCHVMNVMQHKTQVTYGAAQISLKQTDFAFLESYINNIRSKILDLSADTEDVFVSWKGRPLTQSDVANIITVELTCAVERDLRVSCTIMRKSIVSILLQMDLGVNNEQDLASLMKHSDTMQKRTYDVRVADQNMARMSNLVYKVMSGQSPTCKDLSRTGFVDGEDELELPEGIRNSEERQSTNNLSSAVTSNLNAPLPGTPNTATKLSEGKSSLKSSTKEFRVCLKRVDSVSHSIPTATSSSPEKTKSPNTNGSVERGRWPDPLRQKIRKSFEEEIKQRSIRKERILQVLEENSNLLISVEAYTGVTGVKDNAKRVLDIVRGFVRYARVN